MFLAKYMCRQYGMETYVQAAEEHDWLKFEGMDVDDHHLTDPLVIYGQTYRQIKFMVANAIATGTYDELHVKIQ